MIANDEIEIAARKLRINLGIDDQTRPDMSTVIFKLKDQGMIKDYVRVPDHEMPNDEARYDSITKLLYLRESTFCAANSMFTYSSTDRRRARYTIAHEVGHVALGHDGIRFRGNTAAVAEQVVQKIRRQESEANRFAAAFLAPAHLA
jgi:Zn-dependent peptidase ImmA (M78 family)